VVVSGGCGGGGEGWQRLLFWMVATESSGIN